MFDDAAAFDRAAKKAIKGSGRDPGEAYRQMLRDRFLCRVFINSDRYILKGGSGMLARVADSRATRDIDLALAKTDTTDNPIADLKALAGKDLGDWCRFVLDRHEETRDENGHSRLLKLRFSSYIGEQEKDPILIDLSLDLSINDLPQKLVPANRIEIEGATVSDYLVYPLVDQVAEKLCAIVERHGDWPSSRVKDLVDLVIIALREPLSGSKLQAALRSEFSKRNLAMVDSFSIPTEWHKSYPKIARDASLNEPYSDTAEAVELVRKLVDPALLGLVAEKTWIPESRLWESCTQLTDG
jgi:hypothetical protein